jgi:hypothetical protein
VINAPFLFSLVWSVVSPWINERTREKISIVGTNYKDELLKVGPRFKYSNGATLKDSNITYLYIHTCRASAS